MARLPDDETLMAYVDGALPDAEMRRIEAIVQTDASVRARLVPFELTRARLPNLISDALSAPMPARLIETVMTAPLGIASRPAHPSMAPKPTLLRRLSTALLPEMPAFAGAFALAASVALIAGAGFLTAKLLTAESGAQLEASLQQEAIAAGPLREALERVASGTRFESGLLQVTPVLTVRDHEGRFCRQYSLQRAGGEAVSGFACRNAEGHWSIAFHAPNSGAQAAASDTQDYQPASGEGASAIDQFIDKASRGDVVTGRDEAELISKGWPRT